MPTVNLPQSRANTLSSNNKLAPVLLDASASRQVSAVTINPNAAAVRFAPVAPPSIIVDTTLSSVANMANVWTQAALKYQEEEALVKAEDSLLKLQIGISELSESYQATSSKETVDGYASYADTIKSTVNQFAEGLDPNVKAKVARGAVELQSRALMAGAEHKAKQFRVWQGEVIEAKEVALKQNLVKQADDPVKFMGAVGQYLQELGGQKHKSPEAILVEQDKFYNGILDSVIDTQLSQAMAVAETGGAGYAQHIDLVKQYLNIGLNSDFAANGEMLARKSKALGDTLTAINGFKNQKEIQDSKAQEKADKIIRQTYTELAIRSNDPSVINNIADIDDRSKALQMYNTFIEGPTTSPIDALNMYSQISQVTENPDQLWDPDFYPSVNPKDKITMYGKVEPIHRQGRQHLIKDAGDFATSILKPASGSGMFSNKEQYAQQHASITNRIINDLNIAAKQKLNLEAAYEQSIQGILNDENFKQNYPQAVIKRERLAVIPGIPNSGLLHFDKLPDADIKVEFGKASKALLAKHNLLGLTAAERADALSNNSAMRAQFAYDAQQLMLQKLYYTSYRSTEGTTDNAALGRAAKAKSK